MTNSTYLVTSVKPDLSRVTVCTGDPEHAVQWLTFWVCLCIMLVFLVRGGGWKSTRRASSAALIVIAICEFALSTFTFIMRMARICNDAVMLEYHIRDNIPYLWAWVEGALRDYAPNIAVAGLCLVGAVVYSGLFGANTAVAWGKAVEGSTLDKQKCSGVRKDG